MDIARAVPLREVATWGISECGKARGSSGTAVRGRGWVDHIRTLCRTSVAKSHSYMKHAVSFADRMKQNLLLRCYT